MLRNIFVMLVWICLFSCSAYGTTNSTWITTGSMNTPRWLHTATLLQNGQVLVVGGVRPLKQNTPSLTSAEIYNPSTGKWTATGSMTTGRCQHTATLLPNGKVLVAGGYEYNSHNSTGFSSAELYDPVTGTWSDTGSMNIGRSVHSATLLPNGKVLVASGIFVCCDEYLINTSELYDPITGVWTNTGTMTTVMPIEVTEFGLALLQNGKVLAIGLNASNNNITSAELYNPTTGIWEPNGAIDAGTVGFLGNNANLISNGHVVVNSYYNNGGILNSTTKIYNPVAATWLNTSSMSVSHFRPTVISLRNDNILASGGILKNSTDNNDDNYTASSISELYDPATGLWATTNPLNTARVGHTATLLSNGQVLVVGGLSYLDAAENTTGASAELYDSIFLLSSSSSSTEDFSSQMDHSSSISKISSASASEDPERSSSSQETEASSSSSIVPPLYYALRKLVGRGNDE